MSGRLGETPAELTYTVRNLPGAKNAGTGEETTSAPSQNLCCIVRGRMGNKPSPFAGVVRNALMAKKNGARERERGKGQQTHPRPESIFS